MSRFLDPKESLYRVPLFSIGWGQKWTVSAKDRFLGHPWVTPLQDGPAQIHYESLIIRTNRYISQTGRTLTYAFFHYICNKYLGLRAAI